MKWIKGKRKRVIAALTLAMLMLVWLVPSIAATENNAAQDEIQAEQANAEGDALSLEDEPLDIELLLDSASSDVALSTGGTEVEEYLNEIIYDPDGALSLEDPVEAFSERPLKPLEHADLGLKLSSEYILAKEGDSITIDVSTSVAVERFVWTYPSGEVQEVPKAGLIFGNVTEEIAGTYTLSAFDADDNGETATLVIEVVRASYLDISFYNDDFTVGNELQWVVTLTDSSGKALANQMVEVTYRNERVVAITNTNGIVNGNIEVAVDTKGGYGKNYNFSASFAGNNYYEASTASATREVGLLSQNFYFEDELKTVTYDGEGHNFNQINDTLTGERIGDISYSSSNTAVASINDDGRITLRGAGETIITVNAAGDETKYNPATASYQLVVEPATLTLNINALQPQTRVYDPYNSTIDDFDIEDGVLSGIIGDDEVTVVYVKGTAELLNGVEPLVPDTYIPGAVTFELAGAHASNYVFADGNTATTTQYIPNPFYVTKAPVTVQVQVDTKQYNGLPYGFASLTGITGVYDVDREMLDVKLGTPVFASVLPGENIDVTFSGIELTGERAECYVLYSITGAVGNIENNFVPSGEEYSVSDPTTESGWYSDGNEMVLTATKGYLLGWNDTDEGPWEAELHPTVEDITDGIITFYVRRDDNSLLISQKEEIAYKLDNTYPEIGIEFVDAMNLYEQDETLWRYYNGSTDIAKITVFDGDSGINTVNYRLLDEKGAAVTDWAPVNRLFEQPEEEPSEEPEEPTEGEEGEEGGKEVTPPEYDGNNFTGIIAIRDDFRGFIEVEAVDIATNLAVNSTYTSDGVVVDTIAPTIEVSYRDIVTDKGDTLYFQKPAYAVLEITEENFIGTDVEVLVYNNSNKITGTSAEAARSYKWELVDGKEHTWRTEHMFGEDGIYSFEVRYTDRSGNEMQTYYSPTLIIDSVAPEITVDYEDTIVPSNGSYFSTTRKATITIVEEHFIPGDVEFSVTLDGKEYVTLLESSWVAIEGEEHTYIADVYFSKEGFYKIHLAYTDLSGNVGNINTGSNHAPFEFVLDWTAPEGTIEVRPWNSRDDGTIWDRFLDAITFGLFYREAVEVDLTSYDAVSGVHSVQYFRTENEQSLEALMEKTTGWTLANAATVPFLIDDDEAFIVYVRIEDKAGNTLYISSNGIIVDMVDPSVGDLGPVLDLTPEQQPVNGIYNTSVPFSIEVTDPAKNGVYSGLKTVEYTVTSLGEVTQQGALYSFTNTAPKREDLVQSWAGSITVDAGLNNSNEVAVTVTATDNAGNVASRTERIKIDTTAPQVRVSYDNNSPDSTFSTYFNQARTATITVTERNFDPSGVEISVTNSGGAAPGISSWKTHEGTGNGDDTTHTATITYAADGDYTFDIRAKDLAGNVAGSADYAGSAAPNKFTIDLTLPTIEVTFDNNNPHSTSYYGAARIATVRIVEHNFETSRINVNMTATDNGSSVAIPAVSSWSSSGDTHTATIAFDRDADYSLDIAYTDMAGNEAVPYGPETFTVDLTEPELTITGVEDKSANNGEVAPVITYSDTNMDLSSLSITLVGSQTGRKDLKGITSSVANGQSFVFDDFAHEKEMDDVYTLTAAVTDLAGHTTEESIMFSVNRFGSTFMVNESTAALNGTFVTDPVDIIFTEVNVDAVEDNRITLYKDSETRAMEAGTNYSVSQLGSEGTWYTYDYTVHKENFTEDGVYSLSFYSKDRAGNESENSMDDKALEINFGVDNTPPVVNPVDLADHTTYPEDTKRVEVLAADNLRLVSVEVSVEVQGGNSIAGSWSGEELDAVLSLGNNFVFTLGGNSSHPHKIIISAVDAAGNKTVQTVESVYVTTNPLVRFLNNGALVGITLGVALLTVAGLGVTAMRRKRITKTEEEE